MAIHDETVAPRLLMRILALFWTTFLVLYVIRTLLIDDTNQITSIPRRVAVSAAGAGLSWGMYLILRRARPITGKARFVWVASLSVSAGCVFAVINSFGFYLLSPLTNERCLDGAVCEPKFLWLIAKEYSVNFSFVFAAWGLLYLWLESAAQTAATERLASRAREQARLAEIRALRYQVNPHFLFNCLNSLATLVNRRDVSEAEDMIGELSAFLRYGLAADPIADVEVADEVDMQLRYLTLERRRFAHRMAVTVDIEYDVRHARLPALILQPLVENAIKHGVATTSAPVHLSIRAFRADGTMLVVRIEDDAWTGSPSDQPSTPIGLGIGLRNVADRLLARFGDAAQLVARTLPAGGFRSEILVPLLLS